MSQDLPHLGVEIILRVKVFDPRPSSCSTLASLPDDSSPGPSWNLHISNRADFINYEHSFNKNQCSNKASNKENTSFGMLGAKLSGFYHYYVNLKG